MLNDKRFPSWSFITRDAIWSASGNLQRNRYSLGRIYYTIIVLDRGRTVIYESRRLRYSELLLFNEYFPLIKPGFKVKLVTHYEDLSLANRLEVIKTINPTLRKKRSRKTFSWEVVVPKPSLQRATVNARARLAALGKTLKASRVRLPWSSAHKSNTRPSPEARYRLMRRYTQTGNVVQVDTYTNERQFYRTYTSVRTPNFGRLKKRHLPQNPFSCFQEDTQDGGFFRQVEHDYPPAQDQNSVVLDCYRLGGPGLVTLYGNHITSAYTRCLGKLIDKSDQGINNLAQDFYEMSQTTKMVTKTVIRIAGAIKALKAKNLPQALKFLWDAKAPSFRQGSWMARGLTSKQIAKKLSGKELANNWLELQYGWKPLLQDVEGVFKSLAMLNAGNADVQTVSASATADERSSVPLIGNSGGHLYNSGSSVHITNTRCKMSLRYRVDDHAVSFLRQTGFRNPINLAWEVLPYSFVIDWFMPIGNYLQSINAWEGLTFLDGHKTTFTQEILICDCRGNYEYKPNANDIIRTYQAGSFFQRVIRYDREKLTSFPTGRPPSFKNPFSTAHVLNALALLRGLFKH